MKTFLLILLASPLLCAQTPPPIMLTVTTGTDNPLGHNNAGWVAYWQPPSVPILYYPVPGGAYSNVWVPESSTDGGFTWRLCGNHAAQLNPRSQRAVGLCYPSWNWTEVGNSSTQVRIRRVDLIR